MSEELDAEIKLELAECRGVIHAGANLGQERDLYASHDLAVLWFEPNPEIFEQLQNNIKGFPKQLAYSYLLTDKDNEIYTLNIANNEGQSSSIFDLHKHKDICPDVFYTATKSVTSITLDTFMRQKDLNPANYQKLNIDTQGSDLMVLMGATETLKHMNYVQVEVSTLELYKNGCREKNVTEFLELNGFEEYFRDVFVGCLTEGTWSEIIYKRTI